MNKSRNEYYHIKVIASVIMIFFSLPAFIHAADKPNGIIDNAWKLMRENRCEDANKLLLKIAATNPDNEDVYWMIAKTYNRMGEMIPNHEKDKKFKMFKECEIWARKGYERNPELADNAHFIAIGILLQGSVKGEIFFIQNRNKLREVEYFLTWTFNSREYHFKTEESNTISQSNMVLGHLYRILPDSRILKFFIGTKGDLDKSVEHNRMAVEMFPQNIEYNLQMGVSLLCRGQKRGDGKDIQEGKKYLNRALEIPTTVDIRRIDQHDARGLLNDHSLACGYTRSQQLEEMSDRIAESD